MVPARLHAHVEVLGVLLAGRPHAPVRAGVAIGRGHRVGGLLEGRQAAQAGALPADKLTTLAQIVAGRAAVPAKGMIAFKSVGTALQDVALAGRYYELLGARSDLPGKADFLRVR